MHRFRAKQGSESKAVRRPGWQAQPCVARGWVAREPREKGSFVLRAYIVGGMGVEKLHID